MAHTNYRKLPLWKRPAPSVFMIPNYSELFGQNINFPGTNSFVILTDKKSL